nr:hypothetical protein [Kitasatospora sp. SID7827]
MTPEDGPPDGSPAERAARIGGALHRLTGREPVVEQVGGGAFRVTARVTGLPDEAVAAAVLGVLRTGDRFGHSRTGRWERLWAEVGA